MRRGLIARSLVELPDAALDARLDRVRAAMQTAQFDALLVYTNNTRPAAVSWLTSFVPYWSEAVLVVPRQGPTYLVVALSFRVKSWIERTSHIGDVLHTPRIGLKAAQQIAAAHSGATVGVVDFDGLPAGIADDVHEGGPGLTLRDASELFAALRAKADPAEITCAMKAAAIAREALGAAPVAVAGAALGETLGAVIAGVERQARMRGAEEIYIAAAPDLARERRLVRIEGDAALGKTFALRATVAYRGTWVRSVRTFGAAARAADAAARFADAVARLPGDAGFAGFAAWQVEGCRMAQPLEPLMGTRLGGLCAVQAGAIVSVQATLVVDGQPILVGAPALIGARGETASLLADPIYQ